MSLLMTVWTQEGRQAVRTLQALPGKDDCRARIRPPMTLSVAAVLGKLGRDLEKMRPMWSHMACRSSGSSWAGNTEAKTMLGEGNLASALPSSWEWGGSP